MNKDWTQVLTEQLAQGTNEVQRFARAEKQVCEAVAALLPSIIGEAEAAHGVSIAELRITLDRKDGSDGNGISANCVIVR